MTPQLKHPARKRTPTDAELRYAEPQDPKVKSETVLAVNYC